MFMNIGYIIPKKIEEFMFSTNPRNPAHKGSLGFPSLIISLCRLKEV